MKATKIIILFAVSILLIAGVLIFAKTRLSPPSFVKMHDPFSQALEDANISFDSLSDYQTASKAYIALDDKIVRFRTENVIDNKVADRARKRMDVHYGDILTEYGYSLFKRSVWNESEIKALLNSINRLATDRLSTGERGAGQAFMNRAGEINNIINNYIDALKLSRSNRYISVADASVKIKKAQSYMTADYLRNNVALVSALNSLPKRIAESHYAQVKSIVGSLASFRSVSRDYYMNVLVPRAEKAIREYRATTVYGAAKPDISSLERQARNYVANARAYYEE